MNTAKKYYDLNGCERSIHYMIKNAQGWGANRIQVGEEALAILEEVEAWMVHYPDMPKVLREKIITRIR